MRKKAAFLGTATNNYAELYAIFAGLRAVKGRESGAPFEVLVYSDSMYCVKSLTVWHGKWARKGWRTSPDGPSGGKPVQNVDVIKDALAEIKRIEDLGGTVKIQWVRGHDGDEGNEEAHLLAEETRRGGVTSRGRAMYPISEAVSACEAVSRPTI